MKLKSVFSMLLMLHSASYADSKTTETKEVTLKCLMPDSTSMQLVLQTSDQILSGKVIYTRQILVTNGSFPITATYDLKVNDNYYYKNIYTMLTNPEYKAYVQVQNSNYFAYVHNSFYGYLACN